jgi:hypothetical protein
MIKQSLYFLLFILIINQSNVFVLRFSIIYAQNLTNNPSNINNNIYSKINKLGDLNITMQFEPKNPTPNKQTKILFQINHLNGSAHYNNLTAVITILDSQGGIYKFAKQEVKDGKAFADYIFPSNVNSKVIIQLYKNNQGYFLSSFDIKPLTSPFLFTINNNFFNFFSNISKSISDFFKNFIK